MTFYTYVYIVAIILPYNFCLSFVHFLYVVFYHLQCVPNVFEMNMPQLPQFPYRCAFRIFTITNNDAINILYISLNFFHLNYYLRTNSQESNYCYKTCKNSNDSKYVLLNYNLKA